MKKQQLKKTSLRQQKVFSEHVRKQIVSEIERGIYSVSEASTEYQVSAQSIYRWIYRYSRYLQKNQVLVVQDKSESANRKALQERIQELEAALGRKQMEVDLLNKILELAGEEYKTDLKKSFSSKPLNGSGSTKGKNIDTK